MRLSDVASSIGAQVLTHLSRAHAVHVDRVCAADKVSDLMDEATDSTMLVSHLSNPHLVRMADLLDVPCICLVGSATPQDLLVQAAIESGKVLLVSRADMPETCRRLGLCGLMCLTRGEG
jgi:hypothetical protein